MLLIENYKLRDFRHIFIYYQRVVEIPKTAVQMTWACLGDILKDGYNLAS